MKICLVCPSLLTGGGGIEVLVESVAKALIAHHEVVILQGKPSKLIPDASCGGISRISIPFVPRYSYLSRVISYGRFVWGVDVEGISLFISMLMNRAARKALQGTDVFCTFFPVDSILFSQLARWMGSVSVYYNQGWYCFGRLLNWQSFTKIDRASIRLTVSQYSKKVIETAGPIRIDGVLSPACVLEDVPPRVALLPTPDRILVISRLVDGKRVDLTLDVWGALWEHFPRLKLVIVGDGPNRAKLESIVMEKGLPRVEFLGQLPHERVFDQLRRAAVLVHPSDYESFGIVILEAMASGVPVVASDLPVLRELTGGASILIKSKSTEAWVRKVAELVSDDCLRERVIADQKKQVLRFGQADWANDLERFIRLAWTKDSEKLEADPSIRKTK